MPIVFCQTRQLAEEWTYRFEAGPHAWAETETARSSGWAPLTSAAAATTELSEAPRAPAPSTAQVRAWSRATCLAVPDRGRLRPEIWDAWRAAHHS